MTKLDHNKYIGVGIYTPSKVSDRAPNLRNTEIFHIHLMRTHSIPKFTPRLDLPSINKRTNKTLYCWGSFKEKLERTRFPKVTDMERRSVGSTVGLGSVAVGKNEASGEFKTIGEAIIFNDDAYRITTGNSIYKIEEGEQYWLLQSASMIGSEKFDQTFKLSSKAHLLSILCDQIGSKHQPFITQFSLKIDNDRYSKFSCKSNGIGVSDNIYSELSEVKKGVENIVGGHVIGRMEFDFTCSDISIQTIDDFKFLGRNV